MVAQVFNPSTLEAEARGRRISEFGASLVYKVDSRTARATQGNHVSKNKTKQTNKQTKRNPGVAPAIGELSPLLSIINDPTGLPTGQSSTEISISPGDSVCVKLIKSKWPSEDH